MAKISIGVIAYAPEKFEPFFPLFMKCLVQQSTRDFEILVHDNADGRFERFIKKTWPHIKYAKSENIGFSRAHNRMIARSNGEFYLCANASQVFPANYLEQLLLAISANDSYGSSTGKVLRWPVHIEPDPEALTNLQNLDPQIIDVAGLRLEPNFRASNIGEGREDRGQLDNLAEVLGGSGCSTLYRRRALEDIKMGDAEYFDEQIWMYKEDVELALRLTVAGYKCVYNPSARVWYRRTADNTHGHKLLNIAKNRLHRSDGGRNKLYSSLHHDYILGKFYLPNKKKFPPYIRRHIGRLESLRHLWSRLMEPQIWREIKGLWPAYEKTLKKRQLKGLDIQPLLKFMKQSRYAVNNTGNNPKLSISVLNLIRGAEAGESFITNFYQPLLRSRVDFPVEVLFVLNSEENKYSRDLEQKLYSIPTPPQLNFHFLKQDYVREHRGVTSYVTGHNFAQNGFARGEYRLLTNDDIEIQQDTLLQAVSYMEEHPDVGIMAIRVMYDDGRVEPVARRFPHLFTQIINRIGLLQKIFNKEYKRYHRVDTQICGPIETDWVCGHFFMVRGDAWQRVGGKDERYFHYMSDVDICREIKNLGYKIIYNPDITVRNRRPPSSRGGFLTFFRSKMMQIHLSDAIRYFLKWRGR